MDFCGLTALDYNRKLVIILNRQTNIRYGRNMTLQNDKKSHVIDKECFVESRAWLDLTVLKSQRVLFIAAILLFIAESYCKIFFYFCFVIFLMFAVQFMYVCVYVLCTLGYIS
jgi:hypothetical protein